MANVIEIQQLGKTYKSGLKALDDVTLDIRKGEIFALLGANGAGKTTLISIVCGLVNLSSGSVRVGGHDIVQEYRQARRLIGLVPQELSSDVFETVWATTKFSRALFGKPPNPAHLEKILRDLSLWERRGSKIITLSGGMKRRVMIAKALAHEPEILFLDEPTAGVDVELRRDMWELIGRLRDDGVTIILTTHYIEEAEQMADRIGVIKQGKLLLTDEKTALMKKLGKRQLILTLRTPLESIPESLAGHELERSEDGHQLIFHFDSQSQEGGIGTVLAALARENLEITDLRTKESSLEEIFVQLVGNKS
jgi:ABC-2 type transport system ATP-binding protein